MPKDAKTDVIKHHQHKIIHKRYRNQMKQANNSVASQTTNILINDDDWQPPEPPPWSCNLMGLED